MKNFDVLKSMLSGAIVCVIVLVLTVFSTFKTGMTAVMDTVLLSIMFLAVFRGMTTKNVALSDTFARASISCVSTTAIYFATVFIFHIVIDLNTIIRFGALIISSAILGILFYSTISEYFSDDKYKFPQLTPRVVMISAAGNDLMRNLAIIASTLGAAFYSIPVNIVNLIPGQIQWVKNAMFSLDNSLLIVSTGYFIGYDTYLKMGVGFIYSLLIYALFPSSDYASHIMNPFVYSVILGFSIMQGVITIYRSVKMWRRPSLGFAVNKLKIKRSSLIVIIITFVLYGLFFLQPINPQYSLPVWIFLLLIPITIVSSMSTLVSVAETGFWFSPLEDILPIVIILLTQTTNITAIILVVTGLTAFEMAGIYYGINYQVSRRFELEKSALTFGSIISNILGGFICVGLVVLLAQGIGIGGQALPVPGAQVLGMTLEGLTAAFANFRLPDYLNIYVFLAACALCVALRKTSLSPMVLLGGILLPFGSFLTIGIGAAISFALRKRDKYDELFSGLAIGDGLVSAIAALVSALS
ncbi:MAG: hypothetical protein LBL96_10720 [Clostridiales bacterium]|jgi:hypothetical protein|nr:hypothetical protein [Clostridiales bacterium]